ncbi:hypothetical protein IC620_07495 [Hazenella sp. IB182357]|uniref:Uncharacterized protein n=1 Tax=Polycladospora coralii TaxID=2771432 RepID=A0A926N6J4_9BACL|nr:hypothetical protein [Polycladospora coralii]MBD1372206.1 hypothetical protein [Polycladospora coralii]MBS7530705.1 hypothetical protein [Polycladospora coralii]
MSQKHKTKKLVGLFASSVLLVPMTVGCEDANATPDFDDDIELCYDNDRDELCDDDGTSYNPNNYLVLDGKKVAYIKDQSLVSSGSSGVSKLKKGIGSKSAVTSGG